MQFPPPRAPARERTPGRNDPCPCGSGRKFKHCHGDAARRQPGAGAAATNAAAAASHANRGLALLRANRFDEAIASFEQVLRLQPDDAVALFNLASAQELQQRPDAAIAGFRRSIAASPAFAEAHEKLGNLLLERGETAAARSCFERVATLAPERTLGRIARAKLLAEDGKPAAAIAVLQDAARFDPEHSELHRFLGTLQMQLGRFDDARQSLLRAVDTSNLQVLAFGSLVNTRRMGADDAALVSRIEAMLTRPDLPPTSRAPLHFALAKAYDDLGRAGEAMAQYDAANAIARAGMFFDRAGFAVGVDRLIAGFDATAFAAEAANGDPDETPLLIVGTPRSGTTLVEQIISAHPRAAGAGELQFWTERAEKFARRAGGSNAALFRAFADDYRARLSAVSDEALLVTDKMPENFLWLGLIHMVLPRARIVHVRRHPVDACLSIYFANFSSRRAYASDRGDLVFYYRQYQRLMAHWRAVLPPDRFLEIDYEDLIADREATTTRLMGFCGLEWDEAVLRPQDNVRPIATASLWQARQPVFASSVARWRRYQPWLGELRALLDDGTPEQEASGPADDGVAEVIRAARGHEEAGRRDEALEALRTAIAAHPSAAEIFQEIGLIHLRAARPGDAVEGFARAVALAPGDTAMLYHLGFACERLRRYDEAMAAYRRAVAIAPDFVEAHLRLATLAFNRGDLDAARAGFRAAASCAPGSTFGQLALAKLALADGDTPAAEAALRTLLQADPRQAEALHMLGTLRREEGDFAEAIALLEAALAADPERVTAWLDLVHSKRIAADDVALPARIQAALDAPGRNDFERGVLHFALGKVFDDRGEHARAMTHFDRGNALEHAGGAFDAAAFDARIDKLIADYPASAFTVPASAPPVSPQPLLVVGMPRSGTTLVEQIVSSHAEVAGGGELGFWDEALARGDADVGPAYIALLRALAPGARAVTDKNPFNFLNVGAILTALPSAKIIHCRRDPIDTCLSIYFTRFAVRQDFAYDRASLAAYWRGYDRLMAHWRRVLPADRFIEAQYEHLVGDRERATRTLIAACGLEWDEACLYPERNTRTVRSASLWQARQPVHTGSVGRWRPYAPWLGVLAELAPSEPEMVATPPAAAAAAEDADALVRRATVLVEDDQLAAAIVLLERAAALRPDDAVLLADLGVAYIADDRPEAALAPLRRAAELDPTLAVANYNLGIACELLSRDEDALVAYRTALFVSPGLVEAHERLGNLLLARGELEAALGCFRRAADAAPDSARGCCARARLHLYEDRAADAEVALRRAEALDPENAEVQRVLGRALQELGRFDEAIAAFARAVALEPAQVAALSGIVLSRKVTDADADLLAGMDAALADPVRTDHERISLHFGLGKANDDLGRYETAMHHFDTANTLKSRGRPFDRARFASLVQGLKTQYPGAQAPTTGVAWQTPVFIIGMPRSGTTLVEQILSSHATVTGAGELTFWPGAAAALARKGGNLTAADALELASEFRALLDARAPGAQRVTDKNPFNFLHVGLIHAVFPNAKFVHVRRDPVDTCLSNYFNDLIRQDFPNTKADLVFYHAQYTALMAHWRAVLPASCLFDLDYETLIAERERVTRELVSFCGLDWDDACLEPEQNRRVVRTASLWQARQPVYRSSIARWRNYVPWLGELAALRTDAAEERTAPEIAAHSPVPVDTFSTTHLRKLRETHRVQERFGTHRHAYLHDTMREVAHDLTVGGGVRPSLLDYGCGKGTFMQEMRALELFGEVTGYDPGIPGVDVKPDRRSDLVTCLDVLDQVEAGYRDQVVRDVAQFAGAAALFCIITQMAAHWAHLPVQRPLTWRSLIARHMRVTRMIVRPSTAAEIAEGAALERVILVAAAK